MATFTRREFVRRSARLGAAAALASQLEWLSACGGTVKKAPSQADWARLGARLKGTLVRPDDARYASLRLPFNRRYDYVHPQGIVVCAAPEDVSKSDQCAGAHQRAHVSSWFARSRTAGGAHTLTAARARRDGARRPTR